MLYLGYVSILSATENAQGTRSELEQNPKHKMSLWGNVCLKTEIQSMTAIPNMRAMLEDSITVERAEQVGSKRANLLKVSKYIQVIEGHLCFFTLVHTFLLLL